MEYYIIYDLNDNIIAYIENLKELSVFTGLRIKDINYKFNNSLSSFIYFVLNNSKYKICKFN